MKYTFHYSMEKVLVKSVCNQFETSCPISVTKNDKSTPALDLAVDGK